MFSRKSSSGYALLIDVGSGSVGVALTAEGVRTGYIWSHREHTPLKITSSVGESSKAVITSLMNAMLVFETEGRAALSNHNKSAKITSIQATVSAPWSYTLARTVKFENDEPFVITEQLLTNLAATAADQAVQDFGSEHSLESLGVQETSRTILDPHANGYRITKANKQEANQLHVTHVSSLIRTEIVASLEEMRDKLFPNVPVELTSFMISNYYVADVLQPVGVDFCLVDITNEATELGIVRHNALQYSTHVAYGRASIAREIAAATKVPLHDAFSSIRSIHKQEDLHKDIETTLDIYKTKLEELFKETGDRLTIPKQIYLLVDAGLADFFSPIVEAAGKASTRSNVLVTPITPEMIYKQVDKTTVSDTPLMVGEIFFHTRANRPYFQFL